MFGIGIAKKRVLPHEQIIGISLFMETARDGDCYGNGVGAQTVCGEVRNQCACLSLSYFGQVTINSARLTPHPKHLPQPVQTARFASTTVSHPGHSMKSDVTIESHNGGTNGENTADNYDTAMLPHGNELSSHAARRGLSRTTHLLLDVWREFEGCRLSLRVQGDLGRSQFAGLAARTVVASSSGNNGLYR